ncbi:MAG TPA: TylF/MycF/NovP-related O-methyltransferase [Mycobacteriales bacterium]|nr:TylF/MycF/NovP-related O-methyltransferase [Mycobacteriales bacterium]
MLKNIREALRVKLIRAVDDVIARHHAEHDQLLRDELKQLKADFRDQAERIVEFARAVEIRDRRDLVAAGERAAARESAEFAREHMSGARTFPDPATTMDYALSLVGGAGMALEFGVYTGATLTTIARACIERAVYGFDSFDGLPQDWRAGFPAGTFAASSTPHIAGVKIVTGLFADTLPRFLHDHPDPVAFLHLDADLYSSTRTVLHLLGPRLRAGSVIVFDEYFNYPGWIDHEHRAWQEFIAQTNIRFSYEAYTHDNEQVVVRIMEN